MRPAIDPETNQLELLPAGGKSGARRPRKGPSLSIDLAEKLPIAQVRIDSPLPQLDRIFDYTISQQLDNLVQPGVRVRVRFSGRLVNGFVVGRVQASDAGKALRPIERVVSAERVLTAEVCGLVSAVAEHYAGTFSDVVRSAVPPRHARAESLQYRVPEVNFQVHDLDATRWSNYTNGSVLLDRLSSGNSLNTRGVWSSAPAQSWYQDIASLVRATLVNSDGSAIVVLPDAHDVDLLAQELVELRDTTAILTADQGPERRYREFLRALRGSARLVIGTRAAVFAPVSNLQLMVVWDDQDDSLWESHAPYWNARDVAAIRSSAGGCALLVGSPARSVETQLWCEQGWAQSLAPTREAVSSNAPIIRALEQEDLARDVAAASARLPHMAWSVAKEGLKLGPVLVQVPRRGYLPALSCQQCRAPARCSCGGPLGLATGQSIPTCIWCGVPAAGWSCRLCGDTNLRAVAIGVERTAEEFGRAFPSTPVIWSQGSAMRRSVSSAPALVIATPGAEPIADGGYAAVIILDARGQLLRPQLQVTQEAARRWFGAALLARPRAPLAITAENSEPVVQALIRWDAPWFAQRELADRAAAGLPPNTKMAVLHGALADINDVLSLLTVEHKVLGPAGERCIVVVRRDLGAQLAGQLRVISAMRAAKSSGKPVNVVCDPREPISMESAPVPTP